MGKSRNWSVVNLPRRRPSDLKTLQNHTQSIYLIALFSLLVLQLQLQLQVNQLTIQNAMYSIDEETFSRVYVDFAACLAFIDYLE